jgi:hypothetical protein
MRGRWRRRRSGAGWVQHQSMLHLIGGFDCAQDGESANGSCRLSPARQNPNARSVEKHAPTPPPPESLCMPLRFDLFRLMVIVKLLRRWSSDHFETLKVVPLFREFS